MKKLLIKIGGTLLDCEESRLRLAREIATVAQAHRVIVVHGGGKQMTRYLKAQGIESQFVNGLRVSTPEVTAAVLKIFKGTVNAELVMAFRVAGASAVGLTGMDASLVDAEPLGAEFGSSGTPRTVSPKLVELLMQNGYLPVIACVAGDETGRVYNVNADQMAAAVASACGVDQLVFLTDVEGVREGDRGVLPVLNVARAGQLIEAAVAVGGMRAKLEAAISALRLGVGEIVIGPGAVDGAVEKLTPSNGARRQIGTLLTR